MSPQCAPSSLLAGAACTGRRRIGGREAVIAVCNLAFDVVVLPIETPFLGRTRALGKCLSSGGEVAVLQALDQFVLYTGVTPIRAQVDAAAAFAGGDRSGVTPCSSARMSLGHTPESWPYTPNSPMVLSTNSSGRSPCG